MQYLLPELSISLLTTWLVQTPVQIHQAFSLFLGSSGDLASAHWLHYYDYCWPAWLALPHFQLATPPRLAKDHCRCSHVCESLDFQRYATTFSALKSAGIAWSAPIQMLLPGPISFCTVVAFAAFLLHYNCYYTYTQVATSYVHLPTQ